MAAHEGKSFHRVAEIVAVGIQIGGRIDFEAVVENRLSVRADWLQAGFHEGFGGLSGVTVVRAMMDLEAHGASGAAKPRECWLAMAESVSPSGELVSQGAKSGCSLLGKLNV